MKMELLSKEATLIIQKATKRYQSSKQHQVPGLMKVVKEEVKTIYSNH